MQPLLAVWTFSLLVSYCKTDFCRFTCWFFACNSCRAPDQARSSETDVGDIDDYGIEARNESGKTDKIDVYENTETTAILEIDRFAKVDEVKKKNVWAIAGYKAAADVRKAWRRK